MSSSSITTLSSDEKPARVRHEARQPEQPYSPFQIYTTFRHTAMCYMDKRLSNSKGLYDFIRETGYALSPAPTVRVEGSHKFAQKAGQVTYLDSKQDFLIELPLALEDAIYTTYPSTKESIHRWERIYEGRSELKTADESGTSLEQWCDRFCRSKWPLRVLRLGTSQSGIDQTQIREGIYRYIRSTGYLEDIKITFPIVHGSKDGVEIYAYSWPYRFRQTRGFILLMIIIYVTPLWWALLRPFVVCTTRYWDIGKVEYQVGLTPRDKPCSVDDWLLQHSELIKDLVRKRHVGSAAAPLQYDNA